MEKERYIEINKKIIQKIEGNDTKKVKKKERAEGKRKKE